MLESIHLISSTVDAEASVVDVIVRQAESISNVSIQGHLDFVRVAIAGPALHQSQPSAVNKRGPGF